MMKRFTAFVLAALLVVSLLPVTALAADSLTWNYDNKGNLTISGTGAMSNYSSASPAPWAQYANAITNVVINSGVTSIGNDAFAGLNSLRTITIPSTVTSIGSYAFYRCDTLISISIPSNVTTIGDYAFYGCGDLTTVTIPAKVTSVGKSAFGACEKLSSLTIGAAVKTIGDYAFYGCAKLAAVTIPASVTSIGTSAFEGCAALNKIEVNSSNANYSSASGILYNKAKTTLLRAPVTLSGSFTVPSTVTELAGYAFYGCTKLTDVTLPASVSTIGSNVFGKCTALKGIWVDSGNASFCSDSNGVLYNNSMTRLYRVPQATTGSYIMPASVRATAAYALADCAKLTNIALTDEITSIAANTFDGCAGLTAIEIPDDVSVIYDYAFYGCTSLTAITIPTETFSLAREAFGGCTKLTSIRFEGNAPTFSPLVFHGVTATAEYPEGNTTWTDAKMVNHGGNLTWKTYHAHKYTETAVDANCKELAKTVYTCSCGDSHTAYTGTWSDWSTTKPSVDSKYIETKTQYRCSEYETTTSYETSLAGYTQVSGAWDSSTTKTGSVQYVNSWPSGFDTSNSLYTQYNKKSAKVTAGETATTKTVVESDAVTGYLYYHWCYTDSYYSVASKQGSYTTFHAYYSTTNPSSYSYDASDSSYCTYHSGCSNSDWYFVAQVSTQKYTTTQKLYTYQRWTDWSAWTDTPIEASSSRKVETQTLYRSISGELGDHNYVNGVCSVCGASAPVSSANVVLAGDFNSWNETAKMTAVDENIARKTLYLEPGTYEFKIIDNGEWMGNNGTIVDTTVTSSDIGWQMTDTGNCKLTVTIPGEYTFTYKTESNFLIVDCAYAPVYLRGTFNDWGTSDIMADNGNRTYSTTVTLDAGNYTYKVGTSDWTAAWPSEDQALNLTAKSEVTVTLTLKADGNHEVTHTIKPLGSTTTYTCQLAALEVSCDAEVLLRMKMIIGDSIINNDKSYVVMTKDGEDTIFTAADLRAMGTDNKGRYVLEQGIASGEMTYDVTVKIYNGNGQLENIYDYATGAIGTSVTRNVMDYAERIFNLGTQEQKNLIAALVTYGGYSQLHFNTDAGNPAYNALTNCGMSIPNIQSITADSFTQQISRTGNAIGITQTNTRVFLDSAIYMRAYFVLDAGKSIDDYTFTLTYSVNNNERTKTLEPGYDAVNNRYYVDIEDIAAAYLDYMYTITVTNGSGTYVVKTSAMAWAKLAMQATTDVNQINMIKAMYYYNQAANTYFGK